MTTYLITGANRGLGLEFAKQLSARRGVRVLATARKPCDAEELRAVAQRTVELDAADESSIASLAQRLGSEAIDVLINNAGVGGGAKSIADVSSEELRRVFAVNAFSPMLVTRAVLPMLREGVKRQVISLSSQLGSIANNTGGSTYSYRASKAAINQLNRSLANELKPEGFTCVVVHPGWVRTDMGGAEAPLAPTESIASLLRVIDGLKPEDSGGFFNYDGTRLPW